MPSFRKLKPGAKQPKLTDELIENIINAMRAGAYVETAAVVNGVAKQTLYTWLKIANKPKCPKIYTRLLDAVERGFEECSMRDLMVIDKAANPDKMAYKLKDENGEQIYDKDGLPVYIKPRLADWQAAAWRLERRSKKFSKTEKVEMTGKDGGPQVMVYVPQNGREAKPEEDK